MEEEFIQQAEYVESSYNGDISKLRDFSAEATKRSSDKAIELTNEIKSKLDQGYRQNAPEILH